jgi:hypothetical protein
VSDTILPAVPSTDQFINLSEYLQSKSADTAKVILLVDATKQSLSNVRDDATFKTLLAKAHEVAEANGIAFPDMMDRGTA